MTSTFQLTSIFILLCALHGYMLVRMSTSFGDGRRYTPPKPNLVRSIIEIFCFLAVYIGCAVIVSAPNYSSKAIATLSVLGFFVSLLTFNFRVYRFMGKPSALFSALVIFGIYVIGYYIK